MPDKYVKLSDVIDVLSKYYREVVQYSPRQERLMVLIKNDIKALPSVVIGTKSNHKTMEG